MTNTSTPNEAEKEQISAGLGRIFAHRRAFIVIGLTGRTGSGCSSIAKLLESKTLNEIPLPELNTSNRSQEDRKDRIVHQWLRENWAPFKKIQVSQVILLISAASEGDRFTDFISRHAPKIDRAKIASLIAERREQAVACLETLSDIRASSVDVIDKANTFIFEALPDFSEEIKAILNEDDKKHYTVIFQKLGDNIRKSGDPLSEVIAPENLLKLPETIARIIKLARSRNTDPNHPNYFVIDALRHPFEIRYLRERISPFYAVAVTTTDFDRKARLLETLNKTEIKRLDEKEYPGEIKDKKKRPKGYAAFVSQDIQACLTISDIYVSNLGRPEDKDLKPAARQICRYVALMQHPGIITPTHIERCMHSAFSAKLNSGCISRQVGAVITDANYSIKAVGWNDVPQGQVPCILRNIAYVRSGIDDKAYSKYERSDEFLNELGKSALAQIGHECIQGHNLPYCFKDVYNSLKSDGNQVHTRSLHAEENAFLQIVKYGGQGITGGCLFTTASPCELCAKKAYQLGIKHIYYIDPYPGISNEHILSGGNSPPEIHLFHGSIGGAYHNLYEPIMSYKDQLEKLF